MKYSRVTVPNNSPKSFEHRIDVDRNLFILYEFLIGYFDISSDFSEDLANDLRNLISKIGNIIYPLPPKGYEYTGEKLLISTFYDKLDPNIYKY